MKPLSPRQTAAMRLILQFEDTHDRYPTVRELMALLGVVSTNGVNDHLVALRKKGWLRVDRHIMPTEEALTELLGPRCAHCRRGRVTDPPTRLKVVT